jgi:hypothetical protein
LTASSAVLCCAVVVEENSNEKESVVSFVALQSLRQLIRSIFSYGGD